MAVAQIAPNDARSVGVELLHVAVGRFHDCAVHEQRVISVRVVLEQQLPIRSRAVLGPTSRKGNLALRRQPHQPIYLQARRSQVLWQGKPIRSKASEDKTGVAVDPRYVCEGYAICLEVAVPLIKRIAQKLTRIAIGPAVVRAAKRT